MTKPNHRLHQPARRSPAAYDAAQARELAFFDAKFHIGTSRNRSFGKRCANPQNVACAANCGHPGCTQGCTLIGRNGW